MKHWQWHPPHEEAGLKKTAIAVVLGVLAGVLILWLIIAPLLHPPSPAMGESQGITLPGEMQPALQLDLREASEKLVDAIIQIESHGNPNMVGTVGERGLMQIRESTWQEVTRRHFGEAINFDRAFEPELNRQVGALYLGELQSFLYANRRKWHSDLRSLLLACYNAGPERVRRAGFQMKRLPKSVQSYAQRGSALHDYYLSADAEQMHQILIQAAEQ